MSVATDRRTDDLRGRHLLGIDGMDRSDLEEILDLTDTFAEIGRRPIPKVPALRGRTVATVFFEGSTRTRMSFEAAARRLSADTVAFDADDLAGHRPLLDALQGDLTGITDEASAMERAGCSPALVAGHGDNIKITVPEDLALARYYLGRQLGDEENML
mgnify:CR=1 FL=1